jgi:hypothetical protein
VVDSSCIDSSLNIINNPFPTENIDTRCVWCFRDLISVDDDYVAEHEAKILKEADMQVDRDRFYKCPFRPEMCCKNFYLQILDNNSDKKQYIYSYLYGQ